MDTSTSEIIKRDLRQAYSLNHSDLRGLADKGLIDQDQPPAGTEGYEATRQELQSLNDRAQALIDKVKELADQYAGQCVEFSKNITQGADSMSPISVAAGDTRLQLHRAIETAITQSAQSGTETVAFTHPDQLAARNRRIVACLRACEGIPTELLEHSPGVVAATLPYHRLEAQRNELLDTLKGIANANLRNWDAPLNDTASFQQWAQSRARAAIKKAEAKL